MNVNASSLTYPGISNQAFEDFCEKAGIIDVVFTRSEVNTIFKGANFNQERDKEKQGENASNELIRYEFMEALVRIA
jgi:hypothetical protein